MFNFAGEEAVQHLRFTEELTVSGVVTGAGRPAAGALVALSEVMGKQVGFTHCDDDGRYAFRMPWTGRYVLTAYDARIGRARARKVSLNIESAVVNIDIPRAGDEPLPVV